MTFPIRSQSRHSDPILLAGKPLSLYIWSICTRTTKAGGRQYLQLVESYRNESGKPRVRVVASLGRQDKIQKTKKIDPLINGLACAAGRTQTDDGDIVYEFATERGRFSPSAGSGATWGSTRACANLCGLVDASSTPRN